MPSPEPPWWTPEKPVMRRSLSRALIVSAALKVLRAEGVDAVSMRRVATELGTGAASLYAHVAHKEELLELLFDEVIADIPMPAPDPARWKEQITQIWVDSREVLARNGDIARVAHGRVPVGPNAMRVTEASMAILRAGGVPDQAVAWAIDVVGLYVAASAVEGAIQSDRRAPGVEQAQYYEEVGKYFAALPADRFPTTAALVPMLMNGSGAERFRFGLELFVAGLAALAASTRDPRAAGP